VGKFPREIVPLEAPPQATKKIGTAARVAYFRRSIAGQSKTKVSTSHMSKAGVQAFSTNLDDDNRT
jgi:hypothetical protein